MAGRVGSSSGGTGTVKSEKVLVHNVVSPFWTGPLRSPARLQNTFAHESFMDELAARAKADPVEFRLRHLRNERVIGVLTGCGEGGQVGDSPVAESRQSQDRDGGGTRSRLRGLRRR